MVRRIAVTHRALTSRNCGAAALFVAIGSLLGGRTAAADQGAGGELTYRERCASCHGESGEGVEGEFSRALAGDKSIPQLARYIEKRMPKDDPGTCTGEDAERVARYIYDAFYSPIAQARRRPPQIELSRLTVRQYRNAVADLIGAAAATAAESADLARDGRGLLGEYFDSRDPGESRVLERIDPEVRFDFTAANPAATALGSKGFAARWRGSLIAAETGEHEIIIRTDHAARLWLNDLDEPFIDAWVKSGSDTEYRAKLFLLEGRAYPLRLEFTSRNQGVKKEDESPPVTAFVELWWRAPERVEELIPARQLSPASGAEVFVASTPFPPDDRTDGYPRGTSVSKAWEEATTAAAIETARHVRDHLDRLIEPRGDRGGRDGSRRERRERRERGDRQPMDPEAAARRKAEREERARAFCVRFVERAFRRTIDDEQRRLYVDRHFAAGVDVETAVQRVVLLALKSPRFLYLDFAKADPDGWDVAERLSFALWDSIPDAELLAAAAAGQLASPADVALQAARMLDDRRTHAKVREFLHRWLNVEHAIVPSKDAALFPGFDAALALDLRTSLDLFLDDSIWTGAGDFRELLLADELYVNGRTASFYGLGLEADAPFQRLRAPIAERAGIVSHPYLMASFAYGDSSSPIHRGVFILRGMLGRALRPPPEAFTPLAPDLHPDLTTRERVALQTEADACRSCHSMINPLGFALERFDSVGRYREAEKDKPIDASGAYELASGDTRTFQGARQLAEFLAASDEVHRAFATQVFHHLVKQPLRAYGPHAPEELARAFARDGYEVRRLLARAATVGALGDRAAIDAALPPVEPESRGIRSSLLPGGARIRL